MAQKLALTVHDGTQAEAEVRETPEGLRMRLNDRWHTVDFAPSGRSGIYSLLVDGRSFEVYAQPRPGGWEILIGNRVFSVDTGHARPGARRAAAPEPEGAWTLRSPLAGLVTETLVRVGDEVQAGQALLVVESMKMNNELVAARAGTVTVVQVQAGQRVERGTALVRIE